MDASRFASAIVRYRMRAASTPLKGLTLRHAASEAVLPSWKAWLSAALRTVRMRLALERRRRAASSLPSNSRCCCALPGLVRTRGGTLATPTCHLRSSSVVSVATSTLPIVG